MKIKTTAHKGGRSVRLFARVTVEEKIMIFAAKGKLSLSDWIVQCAKEKKRQIAAFFVYIALLYNISYITKNNH